MRIKEAAVRIKEAAGRIKEGAGRIKEGAGGTRGPGCGARGRWRGLAGQRADAPNYTSTHQAPLVWRAPEGPEGTGGLRDRPLRAKLACGDLAGGRARRHPEHPWGHQQPSPQDSTHGARNTREATNSPSQRAADSD